MDYILGAIIGVIIFCFYKGYKYRVKQVEKSKKIVIQSKGINQQALGRALRPSTNTNVQIVDSTSIGIQTDSINNITIVQPSKKDNIKIRDYPVINGGEFGGGGASGTWDDDSKKHSYYESPPSHSQSYSHSSESTTSCSGGGSTSYD